MADQNLLINLTLQAQGDASRQLLSAAEAAKQATAQHQALAQIQVRVGSPPGNPATVLQQATRAAGELAEAQKRVAAGQQAGARSAAGPLPVAPTVAEQARAAQPQTQARQQAGPVQAPAPQPGGGGLGLAAVAGLGLAASLPRPGQKPVQPAGGLPVAGGPGGLIPAPTGGPTINIEQNAVGVQAMTRRGQEQAPRPGQALPSQTPPVPGRPQTGMALGTGAPERPITGLALPPGQRGGTAPGDSLSRGQTLPAADALQALARAATEATAGIKGMSQALGRGQSPAARQTGGVQGQPDQPLGLLGRAAQQTARDLLALGKVATGVRMGQGQATGVAGVTQVRQSQEGVAAQKQSAELIKQSSAQFLASSQRISISADTLAKKGTQLGSAAGGLGVAAPGGFPGKEAAGKKEPAADANSSGWMQKLGLLVGAGFAAQKIMSGATNVINARNDPNIAESRRNEAVRESIPIIGGLIKSFRELREAADGTTARLARLQIAHEDAMKRQAIGAEFNLANQSVEARRAGILAQNYAQNQYRGPGSETPLLNPKADRTTVAGDRDFDAAQRMLPAQNQARQSDLAAVQARVQKDMLDKGVRDMEEGVNRQLQMVKEAEKKLTDVQARIKKSGKQDKTAEQGAAKNLEKENTFLLAKQNELAAARERLQQSAVGAIQAESAARKALIGIEQQRLAVLVEQEQRIKTGARAFGGLSEAEKIGATQAAKIAKQRGVEALTQEQRALVARAGGGDFIDKAQEQMALRDDRHREFREAIGEQADLKKVQQERVQVQNQIQVKIALDEKQLAEDMKKQLEPMLEKLQEDLSRALDTKLRQVAIDRILTILANNK